MDKQIQVQEGRTLIVSIKTDGGIPIKDVEKQINPKQHNNHWVVGSYSWSKLTADNPDQRRG